MASEPLLSSVYQLPISDSDLVIIGRITLMWAQIDVQVDNILMSLYKLDFDQLHHLFANKTITPKVEAIRVSINRAKNDAARQAILEMAKLISACAHKRNLMTHGVWGWDWSDADQQWIACAWSRAKDRRFYANELSSLHNEVAEASKATDKAWYAQLEGIAAPDRMNRKMMFSAVDPSSLPTMPPEYVR